MYKKLHALRLRLSWRTFTLIRFFLCSFCFRAKKPA